MWNRNDYKWGAAIFVPLVLGCVGVANAQCAKPATLGATGSLLARAFTEAGYPVNLGECPEKKITSCDFQFADRFISWPSVGVDASGCLTHFMMDFKGNKAEQREQAVRYATVVVTTIGAPKNDLDALNKL